MPVCPAPKGDLYAWAGRPYAKHKNICVFRDTPINHYPKPAAPGVRLRRGRQMCLCSRLKDIERISRLAQERQGDQV